MELESRQSFLADHAVDFVDEFGTPLYVFDESTLRANYRTLRKSLDRHYPNARVHYAVKANYNLGVLSVLRDEGCGAEAYASCELSGALAAGFDPDDVVLTGMNRRQEHVESALERGVSRFLVDNETELEKVIDGAEATDTRPNVLIRGNPAMAVPTTPRIATATRESKFGLDIESGRAMAVARTAAESNAVTLEGVHLHMGSQIEHAEPYGIAVAEMLAFAASIRDELGVEIEVLDMGGGFPMVYDVSMPEPESIIQQIGSAIEEGCDVHELPEPRLLLEPGRWIAGTAGALLATVGVVKETPHATFAVLDAGSKLLGNWPYPIYAPTDAPETQEYHVAGPLCYSGDIIAEDVSLPELSRGDLLVIDRAGAYTLVSADNTNAEPIPAAVLVDGDREPWLIRERETCEDVFSKDVIPEPFRTDHAPR